MKVSQFSVSMLIVTNLLTLAALGVLVLSGFASGQTQFKTITAERINIVNEDGKTILAIGNKQNIAKAVVEGKSYPLEVTAGREYSAGMVFFNQEGDEMGGLLFNSFKMPNGRYAGIGHLSFDRYRDNQVLALQYKENAAGVTSGLTMWDRPGNGKLKTSLDLIEEHMNASPERKKEISQLLSEMQSRGELGFERVFIGSKNQEAQLTLKDSRGRIRVRLVIDKSDQPVLEFLNEEGKVTAKFPESKS